MVLYCLYNVVTIRVRLFALFRFAKNVEFYQLIIDICDVAIYIIYI